MSDWFDRREPRYPRDDNEVDGPDLPWEGTFGTSPDRDQGYGRPGYGGAPYERFSYERGGYLEEAGSDTSDFADSPYETEWGYGRWRDNGRGFQGPVDRDERRYQNAPTSRPYNRSDIRPYPRDDWRSPGPHSGRGPRGYRRSDERIQDEICERLTQHGQIDASDINIDVADGEVTLTGAVNSRWAKRSAEDVVESVSGVQQVFNRLTINHEG